MKHIGIAAVTAEGAALCYRTICAEASRRLGAYRHPEISLHTTSFDRILEAEHKSDWETVGRILVGSLHSLKQSGADFAIIPANTVHYAWDYIQAHAPLPVWSIVDVTAEECQRRGYRKVGITGTLWTMRDGLYEKPLEARGVMPIIPTQKEQEAIDRIISEQIIPAQVQASGVEEMVNILKNLKGRGCDAVILGCTEIPIIIDEGNSPLPFVDTTRLLAIRALEQAIE